MITEALNRALDNIDLNTNKAAWLRFCEWINLFHEINITKLVRFNSFSEFSKTGSTKLPLKYFESINDLWVKWSKAAEADIANKDL
jgi:hypothetical protein